VQRVTGGEAAPSISKVLERAGIARTSDVVGGLERVRAAFGGDAGREGLGADSSRQSFGTPLGISPAAPAPRHGEVRR